MENQESSLNLLGKSENKVVEISSLELVKLINQIRSNEVELRHSDFLAKVPKVLNGAERNFSSSYLDLNNQERPCYKFPKREASLMAMSYSYEVQAAVYDYMTKLEEQVNISKIPQTYSQALLEAGRLAQELEEANATIGLQAPKVDYFDTLIERGLNLSFRDTAYELEIKPSLLTSFLLDNKYVYRDKKGKIKPHTEYCRKEKEKQLYFAVKDFTNNGYADTQTLITPRGKQTFKLLINNHS